jgi:membrane protein DedA with SNARE-associated domain
LIETMLAALASWITGVIDATGYLGVLLLMAIESACVPLPSEIIMPFAGSLVEDGRFSLPALATAGALGCNLGSTLAYAVGARGGRTAVERWGHYLLLSHRDLEWSERFFHRYGGATVFVSRLLPVLRTFIALPAGIARMPMLRFQVYTFVGSWPWCYGLAWAGAKLGHAWNNDPALKATFHRFDALIVAVGVLAAGFFLWHRLRARRRAAPPAR